MKELTIKFPAELGTAVWCVVGRFPDKQIIQTEVEGYVLNYSLGTVFVEMRVRKLKRVMTLDIEGHVIKNMEIYFSEEEAQQALSLFAQFYDKVKSTPASPPSGGIKPNYFSSVDPYFNWDVYYHCKSNEDIYLRVRDELLTMVDKALKKDHTLIWVNLSQEVKDRWKATGLKNFRKIFLQWAQIRAKEIPILDFESCTEKEYWNQYVGKKLYCVYDTNAGREGGEMWVYEEVIVYEARPAVFFVEPVSPESNVRYIPLQWKECRWWTEKEKADAFYTEKTSKHQNNKT